MMLLMENTEEAILIAGCKQGDLSQFAGLFDSYHDPIYRYIFYRVRHKETTEDLVGTVFMKAIDKIDRYDSSKGSFNSWIYRVAHNTLIDHYRSEGRNPAVLVEEFPDVPDSTNIEREAITEEEVAELKKHMTTLSSEQQEIIKLRVWDELPFKEIAEVVGKTEAGCKMTFYRSMKTLGKLSAIILTLIPKFM